MPDCTHVNGSAACATFDQTVSTRDIKRTDAGVLDGLQPVPTNVKIAIPDGTTLTCDTTRAPISPSAVKSAFVEKFCGRIDGEVFRQGGVEEVCTEYITKMYMYVSTINGDWVSGSKMQRIVLGADGFQVYVVQKDLCVNSMMLIIDGCTDATGLVSISQTSGVYSHCE